MSDKKSASLLKWWLWSPLKFAFISLASMLLVALLYVIIFGQIFNTSFVTHAPFLIMLGIIFALAITYQVRKLPHIKMDRPSFVAIHNIQTFVLSVAFIISSILLMANAQTIMIHLLWMETHSNDMFLIIMILAALFYLYLLGLLVANVYAKFCRARDMNIPTWKIICSMPFGFSMIWTPGYMLANGATKNPSQQIQTKWYKKLTDWVLACPVQTIGTFTVLTTLSGYFFGFQSILLTFALTLVFGIWVLQVGTKNFSKNIGGKFATTATIINAILLVCIIGFRIFATPTTQDVQITISDTAQITQTTNQ